jgi:hypothetical protein
LSSARADFKGFFVQAPDRFHPPKPGANQPGQARCVIVRRARKEGQVRNHGRTCRRGRFRYVLKLAGILAATLWTFGQWGAAASVPRGYTTSYTDLTIPTWFGGFDYLPDGRLIISDSEDVFILDEQGTKAVVAHFEEPGLFASFVKASPDGMTLYVGESSIGTISRVDLGAGESQQIGPGTQNVVATVQLNYDLEFDPQGRAFVSAATPGTWQPNRLLLLNLQTGETDLIATLQGNSGPLAFDAAGNLFYSTSTLYPPQPAESVIFFSPSQIDKAIGEGHLTEADATTYASGIFGFSDMEFDGDGDLFGVTSSGMVFELSRQEGTVVARSFATVSPDAFGATVVRFFRGARDFEPYHENGGILTFLESDFGTMYRLVHVASFPAFEVISLGIDADGAQVSFATEKGKQYQVYSCDDLTGGGAWQVISPVVTGTGTPVSVSDDGGNQRGSQSPAFSLLRERFYKVERVD